MVRDLNLASQTGHGGSGGGGEFAFTFEKTVLDAAGSPSALARAFFIPTVSKRLNKLNSYAVFSKVP